MRYAPLAHIVNVMFIAALFLVPLAYCLWDTSVPTDIGRTVILLSFGLSAFAIGDWYHFHYTNTFAGIRLAMALGLLLVAASALYVSWVAKASLIDVFMFSPSTLWDGHRYGLKAFLAGIGVVGTAIVSIPRLVLIRALSGQSLPVPHDA